MSAIMPVDDYVIAQFTSINNSLVSIQDAIVDTNRAVGEIEGAQKAQAKSLERVEKRLDGVTKDTQSMVDDLRKTTGEIEVKLESLAPPKTKRQWFKEALTADNVKLLLLIVASVLAIGMGVSIPLR